jgi:hypothetical protein
MAPLVLRPRRTVGGREYRFAPAPRLAAQWLRLAFITLRDRARLRKASDFMPSSSEIGPVPRRPLWPADTRLVLAPASRACRRAAAALDSRPPLRARAG